MLRAFPSQALAFMAAFALCACSSASDEEMGSLRVETEALAAELTRLKTESELLDRALTNVYREKDRVVDRLNALSGDLAVSPESPDSAVAGAEVGGQAPAAGEGGRVAAPAATAAERAPAPSPPPGRTKVYIAQKGDTLSQIAREHGTTIQAIVELNPRLANRNDYMVWERDSLILPD
ncbi:MAG: LysM peptidoglycan-binding domain-containing protein [Deltaproteobacteria bacterium]|nr:LysM peptidoglycan-binding domain-containing protein [Deltaproteobacteria bacterium]